MPHERATDYRRALRAFVREHAVSPIRDARRYSPVEKTTSPLSKHLVRIHRLAPLAYWCGYGEFHGDFVRAALFSELRNKQLNEAASCLADRKIQVVLLKGVSYIGNLYPESALRPMADIDLLVPGHQHAVAIDALVDLGYQPKEGDTHSTLQHAVTLFRNDGAIDLHRSIIQPLRWQATH